MEQGGLAKVLGILEATAGQPEGRALADIAAEVGLTKPTAHRILKTLVLLGYMERLTGGVYRQTAQMKQLVTQDGERQLMRAAAAPLRQLWETTGETINLGVLRHGVVVYLLSLESRQMLRRSVTPGMTDPFASTALGRAIAAYLPPERLNYLLRTVALVKRTPKTVVEPAAIRRILAAVRTTGVAVERNETDLGVMCIGAPILCGSDVRGAISLSAPTVRGEPHHVEWAAAVKATAAQISHQLGGGP